MGRLVARRGDRSDDQGFTLVEMVVAMGIMAFLFAALAMAMVSVANAVGVQKSRTQGNDLATIGIEDLQRLPYDNLGLCNAPSGAAPAGMADTVVFPNCGGATPPPRYGPCDAGSVPANAIADEEYSCQRRGVTYAIKRYVAYGDVAHTEKRVAVFVEWDDTAGHHLVSQQSSLRIPSQSAIVGLTPPAFDAAHTSANPTSVVLNADGTNQSQLDLTAAVSGLQAGVGDSVIAVFQTLAGGGRQQATVPLYTTDGTTWTGHLLTAGHPAKADGTADAATTLTFGGGNQFVTFTATRKSDGKVNSLVGPLLTFTSPTPASHAATVSITQQPPSTVDVNAFGALTAGTSFTVKVETDWVTPDDSISMTFETMAGAVSTSLQRDPAHPSQSCDGGACHGYWITTISDAQGYRFATSPPTRKFYVSVLQTGAGGTYGSIDAGTTAAVASNAVTFS